ncbi:MAG: histone deacetylase [Leptospiraceae bacterium]|nr:histone deacetylase [Leptospiraceae bacterium]MCK6379904.1 histone deacetylase [Leptospiraceae bacterium]NUM40134.1 histone deacetylase [Leptospiraceae bacterium]
MATAICLDKIFWEHDTGNSHPENSNRLTSIQKRLQSSSFYKDLIQPKIQAAKLGDIAKIHTESYIQSVEKISGKRGYFDLDTPYSEMSHNAAFLAAGSGITLADLITSKEIQNGMAIVRPPGHHAENDHAMGFCIFNNIAITARYIQSLGFTKILILDWDVHHGNGTERSFYDDDSVFFISLHQYPFYPGTGKETSKGKGNGLGYNLNVPLSSGSSDSDYLAAFDKLIEKEIDSFSPDFILISAGFDAHKNDPLGGMDLSTKAFEKFSIFMKRKASEHCDNRLISFLEGGYDLKALAECVESHIAVLVG